MNPPMRLAISLFVLWAIASGLWVQFVYSAWREAVDPNLAQIAALDKCDTIFPARADGYASEYANSWSSWEASEERDHPDCAPAVGALGFFQFVTMPPPQRLALRQKAEGENAAVTRGAIISGASGPAAILIAGLGLFLLVKAMRPR
jgi:hypothetical protein